MLSDFLEIGENRVHFVKFGHGEELLIALHGFADRARMFAVLEKFLSKKYTVVAFDLPFHGQTVWQGLYFSKKDILKIIETIRQREGHATQPFTLMAFSFGARVAQALLPFLVSELKKIYLLAPDGIKTKGMSMARKVPIWLRKSLYKWLQNPHWFLKLADFGKKTGIVPPMIHQFLTLNLSRPERFRRTFGCWLSMDNFYLGRRKIQKIYRETGLPVSVFFGEKDEMIHFKSIQKMEEELPNFQITLLNCGHRVVSEALGEAILTECKNNEVVS